MCVMLCYVCFGSYARDRNGVKDSGNTQKMRALATKNQIASNATKESGASWPDTPDPVHYGTSILIAAYPCFVRSPTRSDPYRMWQSCMQSYTAGSLLGKPYSCSHADVTR